MKRWRGRLIAPSVRLQEETGPKCRAPCCAPYGIGTQTFRARRRIGARRGCCIASDAGRRLCAFRQWRLSRASPHGIEKITTPDGRLAYQLETPYDGVAASTYPIDSVNGMLRSVVEWGTGRAAKLERFPRLRQNRHHAKQSRRLVCAGHAGRLVCVVWVGARR